MLPEVAQERLDTTIGSVMDSEFMSGDILVVQRDAPPSERPVASPEHRSLVPVGEDSAENGVDVSEGQTMLDSRMGGNNDQEQGADEEGAVQDDFATAKGFLTHVHSLRPLKLMPLPAAVAASRAAVAPVPGPQAEEGRAGTPAAAAAPQAPAVAAHPTLTVELEVHKDASYSDVVQALGSRLRVYVPTS
jgi:hypothetical protein